MFKSLLVALNIIVLLAIKFILGGDISVEQHLPEQIKSGEVFLVEVTISKGDHEGFAKWQQKLPEGFIATVKESRGATFSFKNQEVKMIWMALPAEENITISYEVKTDVSLKGSYSLSGKFSYLEENERKDVEAEAKTIKIGGVSSSEMLVEEGIHEDTNIESPKPVKEATETAEEINDETIADSANALTSPIEEFENEEPKEDLVTDENGIKIHRLITHFEGPTYQVKLTIEKGDLNSFGKIEEYIPEGFSVEEDISHDGIFSFKNQVMKVLWMTIPKENIIEVYYNMTSQSDLLEKPKIHGVFSYLDDAESVQLELAPSLFTNYFEPKEELVTEDSTPNEDSSIINDESPSDETEDMLQEVVDTEPVESIEQDEGEVVAEEIESDVKEEELVKSITDIPSPETNISYKVQIAAGKKEVNQDYFVKTHSISEQVNIEYHENWYKYTLGKFDVYKAARDKRNDIWAADNKINDAFVTAYNSGERISVQEALMISKQKWYK